jgi:ABC-type iron transport system FetAB ATPase subunit
VVTQDAHLFHDTIRGNPAYARPGATEQDLTGACRAAQIHDLIAALPEGLDTVVGDRGYRLSGGEKQRVAIARLLLKAPALVVLDEATAHVSRRDQRAHAAVALRGSGGDLRAWTCHVRVAYRGYRIVLRLPACQSSSARPYRARRRSCVVAIARGSA